MLKSEKPQCNMYVINMLWIYKKARACLENGHNGFEIY